MARQKKESRNRQYITALAQTVAKSRNCKTEMLEHLRMMSGADAAFFAIVVISNQKTPNAAGDIQRAIAEAV